MYLRLSILGQMVGGEKWTVNPAFHFNLIFSPVWDQASGDAIVQALLTAITGTTLPTELETLMSAQSEIIGYRLEGRDEDESLLGVSEGFYTSPLGGTGTIKMPLQSAVVLSLRTNQPGASGRGRMYWPALGATLSSSSGRLSSPTESAVATAAVALLGLIESTIQANAGTFPFTDVLLGVRSPTQHVTRTVVRVQVGDVIDTQRRRRDALPENYASVSYP